jgi:hypothetical protein
MRANLRGWALATVSLTMVASLAACNGDGGTSDSGKDKGAKSDSAASPLHVMTAAAKKTNDAKSAKISMTITSPDQPGKITMSGAMSWDPLAMDMTMSGMQGMAGASADTPDEMRMMWLDNAMYMDMGAESAAQMNGKRWMKIDLDAMAEASGDKALTEKMTSQMRDARQSPAEQLNMMLASPKIHLVGEEKVDGVTARHYRGSMTLDEILKANKGDKNLDEAQRQKLVDSMKKQGVSGADVDVWMNGDDMPVRIDVAMDGKKGTTKVSEHLSDFGVKVAPQAPPAGETFDLAKMLAELGKSGGAGA